MIRFVVADLENSYHTLCLLQKYKSLTKEQMLALIELGFDFKVTERADGALTTQPIKSEED